MPQWTQPHQFKARLAPARPDENLTQCHELIENYTEKQCCTQMKYYLEEHNSTDSSYI